ncbi:hypothetical protein JTB14_033704 [Gonioctena quinquepunctata]|nr:hypothetical protein JTB14_033704 [Gonioctena quinquepunctata]
MLRMPEVREIETQNLGKIPSNKERILVVEYRNADDMSRIRASTARRIWEILDVENFGPERMRGERLFSQHNSTVTLPSGQVAGANSILTPIHGSFLVPEPNQQNEWRPENIENNYEQNIESEERRVTFSGNEARRGAGFDPVNHPQANTPVDSIAKYIGNNNRMKIDRQRLLCFHGLDTENPRVFMTKMVAELRKYEIPRDEWVSFVKQQMKGDAVIWANHYSAGTVQWKFFLNRFLGRYANPEVLARLTSKFYGRTQQGGEKVDLFVEEKLALAQQAYARHDRNGYHSPDCGTNSTTNQGILTRARYLRYRTPHKFSKGDWKRSFRRFGELFEK